MPNTELLEQTMQYIKDHPKEWNQNYYVSACGTAFCFAGTALHLLGYQPIRCIRNSEYQPFNMKSPDDRVCDVPTEAARVLGIRFSESKKLFSYHNSMDLLERLVKELVNEQ